MFIFNVKTLFSVVFLPTTNKFYGPFYLTSPLCSIDAFSVCPALVPSGPASLDNINGCHQSLGAASASEYSPDLSPVVSPTLWAASKKIPLS